MARRKAALALVLLALSFLVSLGGGGLARAAATTSGPSYVQFPEPAVGLCYPWLVMVHDIMSLPTGQVYPGVGGDNATQVYCAGSYFVVVGEHGVYVFNSTTGQMVRSFFTSPSFEFVGVSGESVAFYDADENELLVGFLGGTGFAGIKYVATPSSQSYSVINGVPVALYYANGTYYMANPSETVSLNVSGGTGAVLMSGDLAYLSTSSGLEILEVTNPSALTYSVLRVVPLPVSLTYMVELVGGYLVAESYGAVVIVNVNLVSPYFGSWDYVGPAAITPVGYYVASDDTTYVLVNGTVYPVIGYAVAVLGDSAVVDKIVNGVAVSSFLEPLRTSDLILSEPLNGVMYVDGYGVAVNLSPGVWALPWGAVIDSGPYTIVLSQPQVMFPQRSSGGAAQPVSNVKYVVAEFPSEYFPVARFANVTGVYTGAGAALIIQPNDAILYFPFGVSAVIPGTWEFGGVGPAGVVLYDGSAFRIYDYAGNPITSLEYYVASPPLFTTVVEEGGAYHVILYYPNETVDVSPYGAQVNYTEVGVIDDPTGLEEVLTSPALLEYSGFSMPLPPGVVARVNEYYATWEVNRTLYILDLPDDEVFVLLSAPQGAAFYPLNGDYVIMYANGVAEVLPFASWAVGRCYVNVSTYSNATVYLNGVKVSEGPVLAYVGCGRIVNVTATEPFHTPATKLVYVSGPTNVSVYPVQENATVTVLVSAPNYINISEVELNLSGWASWWRVGQSQVIPAGEYRVFLVSEAPANVCAPVNFTEVFKPNTNNTIYIRCALADGVVVLYSAVSVEARVVSTSGLYNVIEIPANEYTYIAVPPSEFPVRFNITVLPTKWYLGGSFNVTVSAIGTYFLNVTPTPLGEIQVASNVSTAIITVTNSSGAAVARGVGNVTARLPPGAYTVSVMAAGYEPFMKIVEVQPGQSSTVYAALTPVPPPPRKPFYMNMWFQMVAIVAVVAAALVAMVLRRRRQRAEVQSAAPVGAEVT